ncbi:SDR family oxidoreductase [Nocardioides sp. R-C-SC26]|uniref:SDR family oxidoreductase n=1 Tax=Nocardioides sp. R-C-SC26 TaxID=2870414 RepID=UPI001E5E639C|nr:SDR family oxidoreductase [Nocardioides sp. R-C-SC26]
MKIAVAGATGVVGRQVGDVAVERGHEVVPLTRSSGVDLTAGAAVADVLAQRLGGVETVLDLTGTTAQSERGASAFFGAVTQALLAGEQAAGVGHHVALSIVGIDGSASGYYRGKQHQEHLVAAGATPWSVLRATQFHEFAEQLLGFVRIGPVSVVPVMLSQPIAAREVAEALVDLAEGGPVGRAPDLAGPEEVRMDLAARRVARARGMRRRVVRVPLPGAAGKAMRSGALLPKGDGPRGRQTFEEWLGA